MKPLLSLIAAGALAMRPRFITIDNEASGVIEFDGVCTVDNANPTVLRIPYGQFPKGKIVQIFDKQAATHIQRMMNGGDSTWDWAKNVLQKGFSALWGTPPPVVIGHPKDTASAPSYGKITRVEVLDNEAKFHTDWKAEGISLVTGDKPRFKKFSPRFKAQFRGDKAFPFAIEHMGLTNHPVIPVPDIGDLDNAKDQLDEGIVENLDNADITLDAVSALDNECCWVPLETMVSLREKLYLRPDATLEQCTAALAVREAELAASTLNVEALRKQIADEAARTTQVAKLDNEKAASNRKKLATSLVTQCLKALQLTGRVKPAEFAGEVSRIADLDNEDSIVAELGKIAARPPALKSETSMTGAARAARVGTLDNEVLKGDQAAKDHAAAVDKRKLELMATGLSAVTAYERAYGELRR